MILMCPTCYTLYPNCTYDKTLQDRKMCNCDNFSLDTVIELDNLYALAIQMLNQKGYRTMSNCSGHITDYGLCGSFISLENYVYFQSFFINANLSKKEEIFNLLLENSIEVLKWAKTLPIYNDKLNLKSLHLKLKYCDRKREKNNGK